MNWAQLFIDYQTYRDYERLSSVARAQLFIEACIGLQGAPDRFAVFGDEVVAPSKAILESRIADARRWITSQSSHIGTGSRAGVSLVGFEGYRQ